MTLQSFEDSSSHTSTSDVCSIDVKVFSPEEADEELVLNYLRPRLRDVPHEIVDYALETRGYVPIYLFTVWSGRFVIPYIVLMSNVPSSLSLVDLSRECASLLERGEIPLIYNLATHVLELPLPHAFSIISSVEELISKKMEKKLKMRSYNIEKIDLYMEFIEDALEERKAIPYVRVRLNRMNLHVPLSVSSRYYKLKDVGTTNLAVDASPLVIREYRLDKPRSILLLSEKRLVSNLRFRLEELYREAYVRSDLRIFLELILPKFKKYRIGLSLARRSGSRCSYTITFRRDMLSLEICCQRASDKYEGYCTLRYDDSNLLPLLVLPPDHRISSWADLVRMLGTLFGGSLFGKILAYSTDLLGGDPDKWNPIMIVTGKKHGNVLIYFPDKDCIQISGSTEVLNVVKEIVEPAVYKTRFQTGDDLIIEPAITAERPTPALLLIRYSKRSLKRLKKLSLVKILENISRPANQGRHIFIVD
ncbi:MAG: hypothetical protein GXO10_05300 [Crenarchaeota archaeon]|nr:hypothetical protein [Thermoproteota archaeon]